eukprot:TRINITY_DN5340_c0_g1_i3.p1 TRINITY_DN5340_c0_g1~~TRINITY_DN5340_c0_g1_i3.p1  ORF type:complete len:125 (-),score=14.77 TRINITY_DN5340_c0_g1_i3:190-564(-)
MVIDQTLFAPVFLAVFFSVLDTVQNNGKFDPEFKNVKKCWWSALMMNYKMWPAAQFINFSVIPPSYQVLFANFVGLFFNCYLSWLQNRHTPAKEVKSEQKSPHPENPLFNYEKRKFLYLLQAIF